jgi:hypothetical protein
MRVNAGFKMWLIKRSVRTLAGSVFQPCSRFAHFARFALRQTAAKAYGTSRSAEFAEFAVMAGWLGGAQSL